MNNKRDKMDTYENHDVFVKDKRKFSDPDDGGQQLCAWCDEKAKFHSQILNKWVCSIKCQEENVNWQLGKRFL